MILRAEMEILYSGKTFSVIFDSGKNQVTVNCGDYQSVGPMVSVNELNAMLRVKNLVEEMTDLD